MDEVNGFISSNLPIFGFIAFIAGALAYWRTGGFNVQNSIITNFKVRVEQLEKDVLRLTESDTKKTEEIGRLTGIISEKDKYIDMLKEVSLDRNPQMKEFIYTMTTSIKRNEDRDERVIRALESLEKHFGADTPKE